MWIAIYMMDSFGLHRTKNTGPTKSQNPLVRPRPKSTEESKPAFASTAPGLVLCKNRSRVWICCCLGRECQSLSSASVLRDAVWCHCYRFRSSNVDIGHIVIGWFMMFPVIGHYDYAFPVWCHCYRPSWFIKKLHSHRSGDLGKLHASISSSVEWIPCTIVFSWVIRTQAHAFST